MSKITDLRHKAIVALRHFYVFCCTEDRQWSDDILESDRYRVELANIEHLSSTDESEKLQEQIDNYNESTLKALNEHGIKTTVADIPNAPQYIWGGRRKATSNQSEPPIIPEPEPEPEPESEPTPEPKPKPKPRLPTGFTDKYANVCSFLTEKRDAVKAQDEELNQRERQLESDRRQLFAEFTTLESLDGIDSTRYEKDKSKYESERADVDALTTELKFAIRILHADEAADKELCIRLPLVLAMLDEKGQSLADESDPNVFSKGGTKKDRSPEFEALLTEYEEAIALLKHCHGYARTPLKPPVERPTIPIGETVPFSIPHLNFLKWFESLPTFDAEVSELETQKSELKARKFYMHRNYEKWCEEMDALTSEIKELKATNDQIETLRGILYKRKMPTKRTELGKGIGFIESKIKEIKAIESPNLIHTEILSEWEGIEPILKSVSYDL